MSNLITTYRRRILKAALLRHQRKTGSSLLVIKLNKGGISTIELTEILLDGLLRKFERLALGEYGNVEGVKALKEGANKQVISSQADSLIKISRIWADFFPANTSN
ncbi:hypothetical protein RCD57_24785 [Klebsiella pneumoniae]|nr:hypothetical protein [Klebsiella pneumoniae]